MIRHLQNDRGGAGLLLGIFVTVFILMLISALFQNYAVLASVNTVHAAMEKVALTAIARQTEQTYQSKRESYHGAYSSEDGSGWDAELMYPDAVSQLKEMLEVQRQANKLVKYDDTGKMLYQLSNISLELDNPDFQSEDAPLRAIVSLDFEMPLKLGTIERPIQVHLKVTAENKTKY